MCVCPSGSCTIELTFIITHRATPCAPQVMILAMYCMHTCTCTLQEGKELLGDETLEKTRGQTEALKEVEQSSSPEKPHITRDNTMVVTAQVNEPASQSLSSLFSPFLFLPLPSFPLSLSFTLSLLPLSFSSLSPPSLSLSPSPSPSSSLSPPPFPSSLYIV